MSDSGFPQPFGARDDVSGRRPLAAVASGRRKADESAIDPALRAGDKLAAARRQLGLSLQTVSADLKVREDYLLGLETTNVKLLPGKAYVLPFLRSYAEYLGLDAAKLAEQYRGESALTREAAEPQVKNPESKPTRERPWLAAAAIAVMAAAFVGYRAFVQISDDPRVVRPVAEAPAAPAPDPVVTPRLPPTAAAAPVVELRATAPAWLEVRGPDGTIFFSREVRVGEGYRPDVGAGWTIHAKDGAAFAVMIDGVALGPLGEPGAPVLGRKVDDILADAAPATAAPAPGRPGAAG
jgi:hypothetical protein